MPSGNTGTNLNPAGRTNVLNPNKTPATYDPTSWMNPHQVAAQQTNALRAQLREHGYDVDAHGAATKRYLTALTNFQKTKGQGSKIWNHINQRVEPAFVPSSVTAPAGPHPGHPGAAAPANPAVGNGAPGVNVDASTGQLPATGVSTGYTPQQIQELVAQYASKYQTNTKVPGLPHIDSQQYAGQQADTEYGPVIAQLLASAGQLTGAEPGAQDNISKYFAPAQARAAAGAASTDAVAQQNAADQAGLGDRVAASLGLSGAAAGGVAGLGQNKAALAANLATIMHQQGADAQTAEATQEQMAHSSESASNTNQLADLRNQLVAQISAKGQATSKYRTQADQQNFTNENQNFSNNLALQNQRITGDLAARQLVASDQGLLTTAQNQQAKAEQQPLVLQQANDAHTQALSTLQTQKAQRWAALHPQGKKAAEQTPWAAIDGNAKENMRQYLRQQNTRKNPQQAYQATLSYLSDVQGYKGAKITAFARNLIDTYWAKNNPNWGFNQKTGKYEKRK